MFVGCDSFDSQPDPDDWTRPLSSDCQKAWQELRELPEAAFLGLALPRFLLRQPYGKESDPLESFPFEELPNVSSHESYLWGNPALLCGYLLADAFQAEGWKMTSSGYGEVADLPVHKFCQDTETGNTRVPFGNASQLINNTPRMVVASKPPMGWNSWDNFGLDITETEFKQQVDYVAANLKQYGYEYMVIDAGWYAPKLSAKRKDSFYVENLTKFETNVDQYGRWIPAVNKFPSATDGKAQSLATDGHHRCSV